MDQPRVHFTTVTASTLTPGTGTDIFVHKNVPGSHIGGGYTVEIFYNGVKTDEVEKKTKKEVEDLINEHKQKYNTNRAFQNEVDVHVTYKTKQERGDTMTSAASLEKDLYTKVGRINELCNRLLDPSLPLKKYAEGLDSNFIKQPSPLDESPQSNSSLAKQIIERIEAYFNSTEDDEGTQYNTVKESLGDYRNLILMAKRQGANLDLDIITDEVEKYYKENPNLIISKAASVKEDFLTDKLVSKVNTSDGDPLVGDDIKKELSENEVKEVKMNLSAREDKTEPELKLLSILDAVAKVIEYDSFIQREAKDCWNHIRSYKGSTTLDNCISSWLSKKSFTLVDATHIYNQVLGDIESIQSNKRIASEGQDDRVTRALCLMIKYKEAALGPDYTYIEDEYIEVFKLVMQEIEEDIDTTSPDIAQQAVVLASSDKNLTSVIHKFILVYITDYMDQLVQNSSSGQESLSSAILRAYDTMEKQSPIILNRQAEGGFKSLFREMVTPSVNLDVDAHPEKSQLITAIVNSIISVSISKIQAAAIYYKQYLEEAKRHLQQKYPVGMKKQSSNKIEVEPSGKIEIVTEEGTNKNIAAEESAIDVDPKIEQDLDSFIDSLDRPSSDDTKKPAQDKDIILEDAEKEKDDVFKDAEELQKDIDKGKPKKTKRTLLDVLRG